MVRLANMDRPLTIVPREEWGAIPPKDTVPMKHPNKKIILTYNLKIDVCSTKEDCVKALQELQRRHMDEENSDDIKYNFLVGGDGQLYEGRGWHSQPCKSLKYTAYHNKRLDVGFIGDYWGSEIVPVQLTLLTFDLIQFGAKKGYIAEERRLHEIIGPPSYGYILHHPVEFK